VKLKLPDSRIIDLFFISLLALPLFISVQSSGSIVLDRQAFGYESRTFLASFSIGIIAFIFFCALAILKKNSSCVLLISISLAVGLLSFLLTKRIQTVFALQFWILLLAFKMLFSDYSYKQLVRLSVLVSSIILAFQLIILINSYLYHELGSIFEVIYAYNYEQYFSFGVIVGFLLNYIFVGNILFSSFYYLVAILGAVDSANISATVFLAIFPFLCIFGHLLKSSKQSKFFKSFLSLFPVIITLVVPLYFFFFTNSTGDDALGGRADTFTAHFNNFAIDDLLMPKVFSSSNIRDPHNTFLTLGITFGYPLAFLLLSSIVIYISKTRIQELLFISPLFAIAFSLNEPLQHSYTAWLFALLLSILARYSNIIQAKQFPFSCLPS
jgi:hypothetical protein